MGLSIHYSGSIVGPDCLSELISEVQDIATAYGWQYTAFNHNFPENHFGRSSYNNQIYGICFTPPGCESVYISFLSNGKISTPIQLSCFGNTDDEAEKKYLYIVSVKTQFAGAEIHMILVQLMRYLSQKYFARFNMSDEGNYWETSDENLLKENFRKYGDLLNGFASAIEKQPFRTNETIEKYFERLLQLIQEKKKGRDTSNPNNPE